jgi:hypothetical protein
MFQANINDNAFYSRIKSIVMMSAVSEEMTFENIEFSPVDLIAKSICDICMVAEAENKVYHVYNHNTIPIINMIKCMNEIGLNIKILDKEKFREVISEISAKEGSDGVLKGVVNDFKLDEKNEVDISYNFTVNISSEYTRKILEKLRSCLAEGNRRILNETAKTYETREIHIM